MSMVKVTPEFRGQLRMALENPFRFERTERFAMQEVIRHGEVEKVFLDEARAALTRHVPRAGSHPHARVNRAA